MRKYRSKKQIWTQWQSAALRELSKALSWLSSYAKDWQLPPRLQKHVKEKLRWIRGHWLPVVSLSFIMLGFTSLILLLNKEQTSHIEVEPLVLAPHNSDNSEKRDQRFFIQRNTEDAQLESRSAEVPKDATVIVIDAGHGGIDPGSMGKSGLMEKDVALTIAKKVRSRLTSVDNLYVALTRYDDRTITINERNEIIKNIGADLVLSLHLNAIPQEHIALVESYYKVNRRADPHNNQFYVRSSDRKIRISHALAKSVQDKVYATVDKYNEVSVNAGLKTDAMRILSQNNVPGALLEITCLSNPDEESRLKTEAYLNELANGIAEGIIEFLEESSSSLTAKL